MSIGSSGSFFRSHSQDSNSAGVSSAGVSCLLRTLSNGDTERGGSAVLERGMGSLDGGRLHAMIRGLHGRFGDEEEEEAEEEEEGTLEEKSWGRERERDDSAGRVQVTLRSFPGGVVEREERTWGDGDRERGGMQRSRVTTIVRGFSGGFGEGEGEREKEGGWEIEKLGDRLDERGMEGSMEGGRLPTMFKGLHDSLGGLGDMLSLDMNDIGDMERIGEIDMDMGDLGVMKVVGQGVRSEVGVRGRRSDMGVMVQGVRGDRSEAISQKIRGEVGVIGHSGVQVSMRASSNQNSLKSCSVRHGTKINMASAAMDMMELDWSDSD